jgi:1,4-dihydroxy-2-naphthoate octaprenyltransferase
MDPTPTRRATNPDSALAYWKHLRIPFQLSLSPIFLWGCLLACSRPSPAVALGFVAMHLFLYTGVTAYNSAFDRDSGPVGGMERPPETPRHLLAFSLFLLAAGAPVAASVNRTLLAIYAAGALLGFAYSHPFLRWKASPLLSALTVFCGQGLLAFGAGWSAARGGLEGILSGTGTMGALGAACTVLGLYPLTQIYQTEEDASRGDRTLAIAAGVPGAVRLGAGCLAIGAVCASCAAYRLFGMASAALIGAGYGLILLALTQILRRWRMAAEDRAGLCRSVMCVNYAAATAFVTLIAYQLSRRA